MLSLYKVLCAAGANHGPMADTPAEPPTSTLEIRYSFTTEYFHPGGTSITASPPKKMRSGELHTYRGHWLGHHQGSVEVHRQLEVPQTTGSSMIRTPSGAELEG